MARERGEGIGEEMVARESEREIERGNKNEVEPNLDVEGKAGRTTCPLKDINVHL